MFLSSGWDRGLLEPPTIRLEPPTSNLVQLFSGAFIFISKQRYNGEDHDQKDGKKDDKKDP